MNIIDCVNLHTKYDYEHVNNNFLKMLFNPLFEYLQPDLYTTAKNSSLL